MKLKLFSALLFSGFLSVVSFAQNEGSFEKAGLSNEMVSKLEAKQFDMSTVNRANKLNLELTKGSHSSFANYSTSENDDQDILPFARIGGQIWGSLNQFGSDALRYFSRERVGNEFEVKIYDQEFSIADSFSITIPESTNRVELLNHYSTNYFNDDITDEYILYVHYFDPEIMGPEGRISELWVVDNQGEVLKTFTGNVAWAKIDSDGNKIFYTYDIDDYEGITISAYNPVDNSLINTYTIDSDLINFFMGSPFDFITVDNQEYLVVAHYESLFMDNMTMEVFEDNSLIVKMLDYDFQEVKSISLDIESRFETSQFTAPMAEFGTFYPNADKNFNISSDIFNDDDKLEIFYGISYYDMIQDSEWSSFIVANEDGEILHELNEYIIDIDGDMVQIEGHDTQIGILYGEYEPEATTIGFFDIESWTMVTSFEAMQGNDLLSDRFNRIPYQDTYHYLIGLGSSDEIDGTMYGVINEYTINKELFKRHRLYLPENIELFQPIMGSAIFKENLFTTENEERYFLYLYLERAEDNKVLNNIVIASDADTILAEFKGNGSDGNIVGAGLLLDAATGGSDNFYLQYEAGMDQMLVDFYKLPLVGSLNVEDFTTNSFSIYPNPSKDFIHIKSNSLVNGIKIYSMGGKLVHSQLLSSTQSSVNISSLPIGIYIAHITLEDGSTQNVKLIKQ